MEGKVNVSVCVSPCTNTGENSHAAHCGSGTVLYRDKILPRNGLYPAKTELYIELRCYLEITLPRK